jgi:hypothetical protein
MFAALNTPEPTLVMVCEPPWTGACGIRESPSANRTLLMGSPSASAATWVIDVSVPGPMSLVPVATSAVPSRLMRIDTVQALAPVW